MLTDDLAALRALVKEVGIQSLSCSCLGCKVLESLFPAAREALERMNWLQAYYDAALFNWNEVISERNKLAARLARLEEALRRYGVHLGDCPRVRAVTEHSPGACDCGLNAALEGRDE